MNDSFWSGKKVLITGHTGFKGSWLSLWLSQLGAEVTGYALAVDQHPALFDVLNLEQDIHSVIGNIGDLASLQKVMQASQPDVVFHMAAQSLVKPSYESPVETYQTNVMGTVNLLEAVRHQQSVKAVVIVTSDKCYENHEEPIPYKESDRLGGHDPYSNSKACAELVTDSYRKSFFADSATAIATVRAGNVIGGGDWSDHRLIPDLIRAQQSGQQLEVRNPNAIRPWQHVLEPLSGYMLLAKKLMEQGHVYAEAWNFGPDREGMKPVQYLIEQAVQKWPQFEWRSQAQNHHHEALTLMLDCSKVRSHLGWQPSWSIDLTLANTFDWYDAYYSGQNMRDICLQQIGQYGQQQQRKSA